MLALIAKFLGLVLAVICIYLFARESGVLDGIVQVLQVNTVHVTQFFAGAEFHRILMAGVYLLGAVAGLLLFILAGKRP